ncbi:MAG: class II aldolase/adducin family protein [Candidatus Brocadiales bacterium]
MLKEFQRVGRQLLHLGLITSHGGNASIRRGSFIHITRHSAMLGDLQRGDVVRVSYVNKNPAGRHVTVSKEYPVHREIYETTGTGAVLHAHPPNAIALSLAAKNIQPLDAEGIILLGEIPVVTTRNVVDAVGSKQVAKAVATVLKKSRVVMVRGHGSFAVGETLEEALCYTSALEESSKIILALGKR